MHTHTPMNTRKQKLYPYEHLRRLSRQILEIDKVTTGRRLPLNAQRRLITEY